MTICSLILLLACAEAQGCQKLTKTRHLCKKRDIMHDAYRPCVFELVRRRFLPTGAIGFCP